MGRKIMNGIMEQEAKPVLDVKKTPGTREERRPKAVMTARDQPEPWKSNVMSLRRCTGSRSHARRKLVRWSSLESFRSVGQVVFGGDGLSVGEAAASAPGMLSCRAWTSAMEGGRFVLRGKVIKGGRGDLD